MALDPRLILALQTASPSVSSYNPAAAFAPPAPPAPAAGSVEDFFAQRNAAIAAQSGAAQPQAESPGGVKGALGSIFGNSIVRGIMKPLEILDYGRRAAISSIFEARDLGQELGLGGAMAVGAPWLNDSKGADGGPDASWSDWWNQIKDPSFGYGTRVDTGEGAARLADWMGNDQAAADMRASEPGSGSAFDRVSSWGDRVVGFGGDVALDPLSYVTLGGSKAAHFGGRVGREALAAQAVKAGREAGLGPAELERLVSIAGQYGPNGLSASERALVGVDRAGLYMGGQALPGTEKAMEKLGGLTAHARNALGEKVGLFRREGTLIPEIAAEQRRLITGGGPGTAVNSASIISSVRNGRGMGATERAVLGDSAEQLARDTRKVDGAGILHEVEMGRGATALTPEAGKVKAFFDNALNVINEEKVGLGDTPIPSREGYVPHMWTAEGKAWLSGNDEVAVQFRRLLGGDVDKASMEFGRALTAGTKVTVDGVDVVIDGTIKQINELAARAGVKALEDDIPTIIKKYLTMADQSVRASSVRAQMLKLGTGVLDTEVTKEVLDKVASKAANKDYVKLFGSDLSVLKKEQAAAEKTMRAQAAQVIKSVRPLLKNKVEELAATNQAAGRALRKAVRDVESGATTVDDALALIDQEIASIDGQIQDAATRLVQEGPAARKAVINAQARLRRAEKALTDARDAMAAAAEKMDGTARTRVDRVAAVNASEKSSVPSATVRASEASRAVGDAQATQAGLWDDLNAIVARKGELPAERAPLEAARQGELAGLDAAKQAAVDFKGEARQAVETARKTLNRMSLRKGKSGVDAKAVMEHIDEMMPLIDDPLIGDIMASITSDYATLAERVVNIKDEAAFIADLQKQAKKGTFAKRYMTTMEEGWASLTKGSDVAVPQEVADAFARMAEATSVSNWPKFTKAVDDYTNFFKTWATTSPGFHLRNAYSAVAMNLIGGVSFENMKKGRKYWMAFVDDHVNWLDRVPVADREAAMQMIETVFGSGGGQYDEFSILGGGRLSNNAVTRFSKKTGRHVEGAVRSGMAFDSAKAGMSLDASIAKVTRYHFNYSEVSKLDRQMKRIVPFWTFASRNLPLQIQLQWTNPRVYAQWASLVRNMRTDEPGDTVPLSWREQGAFGIGRAADGGVGSSFLAPDLPFARVDQEMGRMADPVRLLADVNPLFRVPFETMVGDRRLYNGQPFTDNKMVSNSWLQKLDFLDLMKLAGIEKTAGDGSSVIPEKLAYAAQNMNPLISRGETLLPTNDFYKERWWQSAAGFMGVPFKQLTQGQYDAELRRQEYLKEDQMAKLRALANYQAG